MVKTDEKRIVDPSLWLIPLLLSGIGIVMITSATSPLSFADSGTPFEMGVKQTIWLFLALGAMAFSFSIPLRIWSRLSGLLWLFSLVLAVVTLVPGIGVVAGGARRWLRIGGFSLQSGELVCLAMVLHLSKVLDRDKDPRLAFFRTLTIAFISSVPILLQPDMGTALLLWGVAMGIYIERFGWKGPILLSVCLSIPVLGLIVMEPYRMRRITAFLDPWKDPLDTGFQAIQGLIAFANGGLWGTGIGHGLQKLQYLPAAYTDFIFAEVGEELGLLGTAGILVLFGIWAWRAFCLYDDLPDRGQASLLWGLALTISLPMIINVGGVTKVMPLTGMPLPFVSYGGTSLLMMWTRIGIILRIAKEGWGR